MLNFRQQLMAIMFVTICAIPIVGCSSSGFTRISSKVGLYSSPVWSPSGEKIAFIYASFDSGNGQLVVINRDGTGWQKLEVPYSADGWLLVGGATNLDWRDDNTLIYDRFDCECSSGRSYSRIDAYDLNAQEETTVLSGNSVHDLSWNQEKGQLAISVHITQRDLSDVVLKVYRPSTQDERTVIEPPHPGDVRELAWSTDGDRIAYFVDDVTKKEDKLEIVDIEDGITKLVFEHKRIDTDTLAWSPDSKWLAIRVIDENYSSSLMLVSADGSQQIAIDESVSIQPVDIDWSPNGNILVVTTVGRPGVNELYLIDVTQWVEGK